MKYRGYEVAESVIEKAKLEPREAMVVRVFFGLETAGGKNSTTRKFVENLSSKNHNLLLESGLRKIREYFNMG